MVDISELERSRLNATSAERVPLLDGADAV